jgi:hypothetical protein
VGGAVKDLDTWPERVGIPLLKNAKQTTKFVADCLNDATPRQKRARKQVLAALKAITAALRALEASK